MNDLPQPKREFSIEEFLSSLNRNNPAIDTVREIFDEWRGGIMRIYKKDSSLYDLVKCNLSPYRLPIIDRPLQIVVEARDFHQHLTGALFAYHHAGKEPPNNDPDIYDSRVWGLLYYERGYGYYFTGARGRTRDVIIGQNYRPDNYDKDLFIELGLVR